MLSTEEPESYAEKGRNARHRPGRCSCLTADNTENRHEPENTDSNAAVWPRISQDIREEEMESVFPAVFPAGKGAQSFIFFL